MFSYVIRRILLMIPTVLGITLLVFLVMAMAPGGVAGVLLSAQGNMRPEERRLRREYLNKRYGLDKPVLVQYGRWLNRVSLLGFEMYGDDDSAVIQAAKDAEAKASKIVTPTGAGVQKVEPKVRAGDVHFGAP